jgi:hypothetical protein
MHQINLFKTHHQRQMELKDLSRKPILIAITTLHELGLLPFGADSMQGLTKRQMVDFVNRFASQRRT